MRKSDWNSGGTETDPEGLVGARSEVHWSTGEQLGKGTRFPPA